jgi:hypothetical protein
MVLESGIDKEHKKYVTMDADFLMGKPNTCLPARFYKGGKRIKKEIYQIITPTIKILKKMK